MSDVKMHSKKLNFFSVLFTDVTVRSLGKSDVLRYVNW